MKKEGNNNKIAIKNASFIATFNDNNTILKNHSILIEDGKISKIAPDIKNDGCDVIDGTDKIVLPGFINCWSYSWQSLFRNVPEMQNAGDWWMYNLAKRVNRMEPEDFYTAARTHYLECLLGGATTVLDCLYMVKNMDAFASMKRAAGDVGIRLIIVRGSMDIPNEHLRPFIQETEQIIAESREFIEEYHNNDKHSILQVGLGPCSILTGSDKLYKQTAELARQYENVQLFSLLGEEPDEVKFCKERSKSLSGYILDLGWNQDDSVFINTVNCSHEDLVNFQKHGVEIVDCPKSNARGSGISKITEILEMGIPVGIGTAGSAGNDRSSMLDELLWTRYLQGARQLDYLEPLETLELGTKKAAAVINRNDLGTIEVGKTADLIMYDTTKEIHYAGAVTDPVGSLVGSGHLDVHTAVINGNVVIRDNKHCTIDHNKVINEQNLAACRIETEISKL